MNLLSNLRLFGLSALVSVAASGCVFSIGDGNPNSDSGSVGNGSVPGNNQQPRPTVPGADCGFNGVVSQTLECVCKTGFSWCDPSIDPGPRGRNHCCAGEAPSGSKACDSGSNNILIPNKQGQGQMQCVCIEGFDWCDQKDEKNLNCCALENEKVEPGTLPNLNESCDPTQVASWCSHTESQGPVGSRSFSCVDGKWVEVTSGLDEQCRLEGYNFSYGCSHVPGTTTSAAFSKLLCGFGPGTACKSTDAESCSDDESQLRYCLHNRLTAEQCAPKEGETCKTENGNEFENGKCGSQGGRLSCLCYDDEPSDTTTGGGDTGSTGTGTGT